MDSWRSQKRNCSTKIYTYFSPAISLLKTFRKMNIFQRYCKYFKDCSKSNHQSNCSCCDRSRVFCSIGKGQPFENHLQESLCKRVTFVRTITDTYKLTSYKYIKHQCRSSLDYLVSKSTNLTILAVLTPVSRYKESYWELINYNYITVIS